MKKSGLASAFACIPGTACAHAFSSGADQYEAFLEGAAVVLFWPPTLVAVVTLGILVSLWNREGILQIWPYLLAGHAAGLVVTFLTHSRLAYVAYCVALLTATLAAVATINHKGVMTALSAVSGFSVVASALEGHSLTDLPLAITFGILFAANLAVAVSAGAVSMSLEAIKAPWINIAWRVAASWMAAIVMLQLAFELRT